jgi:hypothetical protein
MNQKDLQLYGVAAYFGLIEKELKQKISRNF